MNEQANSSPAADGGDDFLAGLRIDQSYSDETVGMRKVLGTVPVRKPTKTDHFRVHPSHMLDCFALELKEEREIYFINSDLVQLLPDVCVPVRLRLCVTRQGLAFIWPLKLERSDRKKDEWARSAAEAAHLAESNWVRITADMHGGFYQGYVATADLGDPKWPVESWREVLRIALRDRRIESEDHVVLKQLRGHA